MASPTYVVPKISCLAANVPGQSSNQCSSVSGASLHFGQVGSSAGLMRCR